MAVPSELHLRSLHPPNDCAIGQEDARAIRVRRAFLWSQSADDLKPMEIYFFWTNPNPTAAHFMFSCHLVAVRRRAAGKRTKSCPCSMHQTQGA